MDNKAFVYFSSKEPKFEIFVAEFFSDDLGKQGINLILFMAEALYFHFLLACQRLLLKKAFFIYVEKKSCFRLLLDSLQ